MAWAVVGINNRHNAAIFLIPLYSSRLSLDCASMGTSQRVGVQVLSRYPGALQGDATEMQQPVDAAQATDAGVATARTDYGASQLRVTPAMITQRTRSAVASECHRHHARSRCGSTSCLAADGRRQPTGNRAANERRSSQGDPGWHPARETRPERTGNPCRVPEARPG